jgi:electron transfer flavoprotein alpha/beta subunit
LNGLAPTISRIARIAEKISTEIGGMLRIVVCVKAVPDPKQEHKIKIDPISRNIMRGDVPLVINPLDRNALESALLLKEELKAYISIMSMGPPPAGSVVKECLALGADEGFLLCDPAFAGADAYATAYTLAKGIEKIEPFDVVLCGMASSDGSTEWVGPELATFLKIPVVTRVSEILAFESEWWEVKADIENGYRRVSVKPPVLFTVTRELNTPRTLSFSGVIQARKKEITEWGLEDLDVSESVVGLKGSPSIVSQVMKITARKETEILTGSIEEKAERLIEILVDTGVI